MIRIIIRNVDHQVGFKEYHNNRLAYYYGENTSRYISFYMANFPETLNSNQEELI